MRLSELKSIIDNSSNIVFFGGAGVSTESNIPDFRSNKGLYNTESKFSYPPEVMLSHSFLKDHTEEFFKFYREKMIFKDAKPNDAHKALGILEQRGKLKAVVTQNIDGLHQEAGSKNVLELHGSIHRNYCDSCGKSYDLKYVLSSKTIVPKCDTCGGVVRPDVVLYEESLDTEIIERTVEYVGNADVLIIGGTSLVVYPAASLIGYFRGDKLVLINKSSTPYDESADLVINDSIGKVLASIL